MQGGIAHETTRLPRPLISPTSLRVFLGVPCASAVKSLPATRKYYEIYARLLGGCVFNAEPRETPRKTRRV